MAQNFGLCNLAMVMICLGLAACVTLTTLGYGDITPVNQTARTLSWLEAAFGQIYLVVLVAHLVSRQLFHSSRG